MPSRSPQGHTNGSPSEDFSFPHLVNDHGVPAWRKYQRVAVGDGTFLDLLKYELCLGTIAFVPGAAGILLRQIFYRFLLRSLGRGAVIGRSVTLRHPGKISIGTQTVIDDYCVLNALGSGNPGINLGSKVFVGRNTVLKTRDGEIAIGDHTVIGKNCLLGATERLEIGRHVLIAASSYIGGQQHRIENRETPMAMQGLSMRGGVVIEDDVWLGAGVIVLDGARIGKGSIIGAGAVVRENVPPYTIATPYQRLVMIPRPESQPPEQLDPGKVPFSTS